MEKQISIIIPTYNMEKYIGKCLDSLLIPEFDKVEVLVVNDGSKDKSSEIAHSYADRYPDSIRVIDKPNGNYGSCVNAALPLCTGRYVKVLDADDTFETKAFSNYVKELSNRNEDVIFNDYTLAFEGKADVLKPTFFQLGYKTDKSYTFEEVYRYIISDLHMHCIAYKLANIIEMKYLQTEGVSYTDNEWIYAPMCLAKSFAFINAGYLYRYLLGREGQTVDPSLTLKRIGDHFEVIKTQTVFYEKAEVNGLRKEYLETQLTAHALLVYSIVIESKEQDRLIQLADFDRQIREISPRLYDLLDDVIYAPRLPYKYIKEFRKSGCSSKFRIRCYVKPMARLIQWGAKIKQKVLKS